MAFETLAVPSNVPAENAVDLYRHEARPEWGLALMVQEEDRFRSYQFEDGRRRKIREDFDDLMRPVDELDVPDAVVETLTQALAAPAEQRGTKPPKPTATFDQQVEYFREHFPDGFRDPAWVARHRGGPEHKRLKRHREPVLREAAEVLSAERCEEMLGAGRASELADDIFALQENTSLLPVSHRKKLGALAEEQKARYAERVAGLLHGEEHFSRRFRAYLESMEKLLGRRPSWRAATALPAIVHPDRHVSVRRSAFRRQAGSIAPSARYSSRPRVGAYRNYRRVAIGVRKRLLTAELEPRDFLDVRDFIWTTLRKSVRYA